MRDVPAIVQAAVDVQQLARAIAKEHIALQDDERNADAAEKKTISYRESAARRRVEIGRLLIEAKRGVKHGGWSPYLAKLGIEERSARNWMSLAGYAESKTETDGRVSDLPAPTLADAGIDKRPRKTAPREEQPDPPPQARRKADAAPVAAQPAEEVQLAHRNNIDRALVALNKSILGYAQSWPRRSRVELARMLRGVADSVESMSNGEGEDGGPDRDDEGEL